MLSRIRYFSSRRWKCTLIFNTVSWCITDKWHALYFKKYYLFRVLFTLFPLHKLQSHLIILCTLKSGYCFWCDISHYVGGWKSCTEICPMLRLSKPTKYCKKSQNGKMWLSFCGDYGMPIRFLFFSFYLHLIGAFSLI